MQTLAQNGYTDTEVLNELLFKRGSNTMDFRYETLDQFGNIKTDITPYVVSASVSNNYFDDIKRTAKFTINDAAPIDYGSDRIRPWVRLRMPTSKKKYLDLIQSHVPRLSGWYEMDETSGTNAYNAMATGTTYAGLIGSSVTIGQAGIASGSSMKFPGGAAADATRIGIPFGSNLINGLVTPFNGVSISFWLNSPNLGGFPFISGSGNTYILVGNTQITVRLNGNVAVLPNPFGTGVRHIGIVWKVQQPIRVFLNGELQQNTTDTIAGDLAGPVDGHLYLGQQYTGTMDSLIIASAAFTDSQMTDLYRAGYSLGPFGNRNFAEWPQGAFMLSAPSRSSDAARYVTRSVDGFDPLEQYSDDQLSKPITLKPGALYTNMVLSLVMNYYPTNFNLDTAYWNTIQCTNVQPRSATITGATSVAAGEVGTYTALSYSLAGVDFSMAMDTSGFSTSTFRRQNMVVYFDANNYYKFTVYANSTSATTTATFVQNGSTISTTSVAYDFANHIFFRIYEELGYVFFQTSPNGSTWNNFLTVASMAYNQSVQLKINSTVTGTDTPWSFGVNYVTAKVAANVPVNITPSPKFIPSGTAKEWDAGTSKLSVINDILTTIAYETLSFDESGQVVIRPYTSPATLPAEFTYDESTASVTTPDKQQTLDLFKVPNRWIGVSSNPNTGVVFYSYPAIVNANPDSPTSYFARGRYITKVIQGVDAPDLVTLNAQVQAQAEQDSQVYEETTFKTPIMPIHTTRNLLYLGFPSLGINDKYEELSWSFELKAGATMTHTARKFIPIS